MKSIDINWCLSFVCWRLIPFSATKAISIIWGKLRNTHLQLGKWCFFCFITLLAYTTLELTDYLVIAHITLSTRQNKTIYDMLYIKVQKNPTQSVTQSILKIIKVIYGSFVPLGYDDFLNQSKADLPNTISCNGFSVSFEYKHLFIL